MAGSLRALVAAGDFERLGAMLPELDDVTELVELLCAVPGREEYLGTDPALIRLIEDVLDRQPSNARLLVRLALELRGDPTTLARRVDLVESATELAEGQGDPAALVEALLARVHAVWEPEGAEEWVDAVDRAIGVARHERLREAELYARRTRVDVLLGLGRMTDAEVELVQLARQASQADPAWRVFLASRRSTVDVVRGRFEAAECEVEETAVFAGAAGLPDAHQLVTSLRVSVARERGDLRYTPEALDVLVGLMRRCLGITSKGRSHEHSTNSAGGKRLGSRWLAPLRRCAPGVGPPGWPARTTPVSWPPRSGEMRIGPGCWKQCAPVVRRWPR